MILRRPILNATSSLPSAVSIPQTCSRAYRTTIPQRPVPKPIPFIPDTAAFLTAIGRGLSAHSTKIPSWDALFTLTSPQLKEIGVEPARARRYLLMWRDRYRNGEFGVGGDCQHVQDGVAELKLIEAPVPTPLEQQSRRTAIATATHDPGTRKVIINLPKDQEGPSSWDNLAGVKGFVVKGAKNIKGPYVEYVKGSGGLRARLKLQEGVWEIRRGHKIDGGERRRAEVRAKRRAAENREKNR